MKEDDTRWGGIGRGGETGGRFILGQKNRPPVPSVVYCVGGKFAVFYCELDGIVRLHFVFEDQLG